MFKPTAPQCSRLRLRLTTKSVGKGYYKGTRTGSMGGHTKQGRYLIDYRKVRTYVCPTPEQYDNFMLTPFVTNAMEKTKFTRPEYSEETGQIEQVEADRLTGEDLWRLTMAENEDDREKIMESMENEDVEEDQSADEGAEEQAVEPKKHPRRTWGDLSQEERTWHGSRANWERLSARKQEMFTQWYTTVEEKIKGHGLGGPKARRIKAW